VPAPRSPGSDYMVIRGCPYVRAAVCEPERAMPAWLAVGSLRSLPHWPGTHWLACAYRCDEHWATFKPSSLTAPAGVSIDGYRLPLPVGGLEHACLAVRAIGQNVCLVRHLGAMLLGPVCRRPACSAPTPELDDHLTPALRSIQSRRRPFRHAAPVLSGRRCRLECPPRFRKPAVKLSDEGQPSAQDNRLRRGSGRPP